MSRSASHWFPRNWIRVVGLPEPGAEAWALRDVPITRSVLKNLKQLNCVEIVERDKFLPESRTQPASNQCLYATTRQGWEALVKYSKLSESDLRRLSADPDADILLGDLTGRDRVQEAVARVEQAEGIDVQVLDLSKCSEQVCRACPAVDVAVVEESDRKEWVEHDVRIELCLSDHEWRERLATVVFTDGYGAGNSQVGNESAANIDTLAPRGADSTVKVAASPAPAVRSDQLGGEPDGGDE